MNCRQMELVEGYSPSRVLVRWFCHELCPKFGGWIPWLYFLVTQQEIWTGVSLPSWSVWCSARWTLFGSVSCVADPTETSEATSTLVLRWLGTHLQEDYSKNMASVRATEAELDGCLVWRNISQLGAASFNVHIHKRCLNELSWHGTWWSNICQWWGSTWFQYAPQVVNYL